MTRIFGVSLLFLVLVGAAPLLQGQDQPDSRPTKKTKAPAEASGAAVSESGVVTFESALFDYEDGAHFVMLSSREGISLTPKANKGSKDDWRQIAPGETRFVILIHGKTKADTIVFPEFAKEDLLGIFSPKPGASVGALLYTNRTDQPVKFKQVFIAEAAKEGKHLVRSGAVVLHEGHSPKKALKAEFAFVFEGAQVAGRIDVGN